MLGTLPRVPATKPAFLFIGFACVAVAACGLMVRGIPEHRIVFALVSADVINAPRRGDSALSLAVHLADRMLADVGESILSPPCAVVRFRANRRSALVVGTRDEVAAAKLGTSEP